MEKNLGKHKTFGSEGVPDHVMQEIEHVTQQLYDAATEVCKGKSPNIMMNAIIQLLCHTLYRFMKDDDMESRKTAILYLNHGILMQYNGMLADEQEGKSDGDA